MQGKGKKSRRRDEDTDHPSAKRSRAGSNSTDHLFTFSAAMDHSGARSAGSRVHQSDAGSGAAPGSALGQKSSKAMQFPDLVQNSVRNFLLEAIKPALKITRNIVRAEATLKKLREMKLNGETPKNLPKLAMLNLPSAGAAVDAERKQSQQQIEKKAQGELFDAVISAKAKHAETLNESIAPITRRAFDSARMIFEKMAEACKLSETERKKEKDKKADGKMDESDDQFDYDTGVALWTQRKSDLFDGLKAHWQEALTNERLAAAAHMAAQQIEKQERKRKTEEQKQKEATKKAEEAKNPKTVEQQINEAVAAALKQHFHSAPSQPSDRAQSRGRSRSRSKPRSRAQSAHSQSADQAKRGNNTERGYEGGYGADVQQQQQQQQQRNRSRNGRGRGSSSNKSGRGGWRGRGRGQNSIKKGGRGRGRGRGRSRSRGRGQSKGRRY
jgi:hypothetical protein